MMTFHKLDQPASNLQCQHIVSMFSIRAGHTPATHWRRHILHGTMRQRSKITLGRKAHGDLTLMRGHVLEGGGSQKQTSAHDRGSCQQADDLFVCFFECSLCFCTLQIQ